MSCDRADERDGDRERRWNFEFIRKSLYQHTVAHAVLSGCKQAWSNLQRCCFNAEICMHPRGVRAQMQTNSNANTNCYRMCASSFVVLLKWRNIYWTRNTNQTNSREKNEKNCTKSIHSVITFFCPCPSDIYIYIYMPFIASKIVYDFVYTWQFNRFTDVIWSFVYRFTNNFEAHYITHPKLSNAIQLMNCIIFFFMKITSAIDLVVLSVLWPQTINKYGVYLPPWQSAHKVIQCWHFDDTNDEWTAW